MMQREILFRAKDESGHWHEGQFSYESSGDRAAPVIVSAYDPEKYFVNEAGTRVIATSIPVRVSTLGQYTFQTYWKGGKEIKIFTEDIAQFIFKNELVVGVVKQGISGAFYLDCGNLDDPTNMKIWWVTRYMDLKWIGNIHDNPELLTPNQESK